MHDHAYQATGATVSTAAVGIGITADKVYLNHDITLNEISLVVGITVGVLTAILQAIRIYKAVKNKSLE